MNLYWPAYYVIPEADGQLNQLAEKRLFSRFKLRNVIKIQNRLHAIKQFRFSGSDRI